MSTRRASSDTTTQTPSLAPSVHTQWPFVERRSTDRRRQDRREYQVRVRTDAHELNASHPCTAREQEIVRLLLQGLTNKQIAQRLGIVEDTVKKHLQHVYNKFGVRRRALIILGRSDRAKPEPSVRARGTSFVE
jgi:DNA-binding CsgD family transcriptional regulator